MLFLGVIHYFLSVLNNNYLFLVPAIDYYLGILSTQTLVNLVADSLLRSLFLAANVALIVTALLSPANCFLFQSWSPGGQYFRCFASSVLLIDQITFYGDLGRECGFR